MPLGVQVINIYVLIAMETWIRSKKFQFVEQIQGYTSIQLFDVLCNL